ncbi:MAG: PAS domain-containing protein [Nitrospinota bacterium]|nr:MAG: PAS domain-containing protein [Nitrospinota bacterium]
MIDQILRRAIYGLDIGKVKIFNADQRIVYSTDLSIVGKRDRENQELQAVFQGKIFSKLQTEEEGWDIAGEEHLGADIIETYIPIRSPGERGTIIGAFEIYQDARPLYAEQRESLYRLLIATGFILLLLFAVQLFIVRRADQVIATQGIALTKAEEALRSEQEKTAWILDNMTEAVIVENANHEIEYMNRAAMQMLGNRIGNQCYKVLNFDEPCSCCTGLWEAIERGETERTAFSTVNKVGRYGELHNQPDRVALGSEQLCPLLQLP